MKNSLSINAIADRIDELAKERKNWEGGAYKTSNAQLYALLDKCLTLYRLLRNQKSRRRYTKYSGPITLYGPIY